MIKKTRSKKYIFLSRIHFNFRHWEFHIMSKSYSMIIISQKNNIFTTNYILRNKKHSPRLNRQTV